VDADAVRMATQQLLNLASASATEGVASPPEGWQPWAKNVSASSAGCGPSGDSETVGDDASGARLQSIREGGGYQYLVVILAACLPKLPVCLSASVNLSTEYCFMPATLGLSL